MDTAGENSFFTTQRLARIATAFLFDVLKVVFGVVLLLAPLIAGSLIGSAAEKACNGVVPEVIGGKVLCGVAGKVVTVGASITGYVLEFGSGVGDAAVGVISEVFDDAIDAMAWIILAIWCLVSGISFGGGRSGYKNLAAAGGSAALGLVPFINLAPTITIGQVLIEINDYSEKKALSASVPTFGRADIIAQQRRHLSELRDRNRGA